jgi:hypothetical protein
MTATGPLAAGSDSSSTNYYDILEVNFVLRASSVTDDQDVTDE